MAAIGQVKIIQDKAEELSALATLLEYVKDPKAFLASVNADVQKVHGLIEDEKQKAADARDLISKHKAVLDAIRTENAKHEDNKAEIASREEAFRKAKEANDKYIADTLAEHKAAVDAFESDKKNFANTIVAKNNQLADQSNALLEQSRNLDNKKAELDIEAQRLESLKKETAMLKAKYEKKLADLRAE